jgi:hypothetical protein
MAEKKDALAKKVQENETEIVLLNKDTGEQKILSFDQFGEAFTSEENVAVEVGGRGFKFAETEVADGSQGPKFYGLVQGAGPTVTLSLVENGVPVERTQRMVEMVRYAPDKEWHGARYVFRSETELSRLLEMPTGTAVEITYLGKVRNSTNSMERKTYQIRRIEKRATV